MQYNTQAQVSLVLKYRQRSTCILEHTIIHAAYMGHWSLVQCCATVQEKFTHFFYDKVDMSSEIMFGLRLAVGISFIKRF